MSWLATFLRENWRNLKCFVERYLPGVQLWLSQRRGALLIIAITGLAIWIGLQQYQQSFRKSIVVVGGAPGSSSLRLAERLQDKLASTQRIPGVKYSASVASVSGSEAIEDRVLRDQDGATVGFAHSLGSPNKSLRALLPLEFDYLHILCRIEFLAKLGSEPRHELGYALPELKSGRVFADAPGTATRRLVEGILARYGRDEAQMYDLLNASIDDWYETRAALRAGAIDVAFYLGPIGATTIEEIVRDKTVVLLGIGDILEALIVHEGYALWPVKFPANAYSAEELQLGSDDAEKTVRFCPAELKTVALRRLLVGSSAMSTDDAYLIATAAYDELSEDSPLVGSWDAPPPGEKPPGGEQMGISKHSGAAMRGTEISFWWKPQTWPPFLTSALSTLALLLITDLFTRWTHPSARAPATTAGAAENDD